MPLIYHLRPATPNIGNDLIVFALHELLAQAAERPFDLIHLPARGITSVIKPGGLIKQTVNDVNQLGSGVLIGPGNLFENNGLEVDPVALAALRFPPMIFSVSWGRMFDDSGELRQRTDMMAKETVSALCRSARSVLVRDDRTRSYLQSFHSGPVEVIGCPVLALQPDRLQMPPPDPRAEDAVIVSVRNPLLMNISPRLQGRVHSDLRRLIDGLRSAGQSKLALLCHDPRDLRFAAAYPDVPLLYSESPLQYLSWLRDARLSITFRLHSFLPCAVFGTPSVHFSYDERAVGLIETSRLQACDVDYVRTRDPVRQALEFCREPDSIRREFDKSRPVWQDLRGLMLRELSAWLRSME